jgi:hypothetical protein
MSRIRQTGFAICVLMAAVAWVGCSDDGDELTLNDETTDYATPYLHTPYDHVGFGPEYGTAGTPWDKTLLTFSFRTTDLPAQYKRAVRDAFATWESASLLNFVDNATASADIEVLWGSGAHGDDYPFDGPGGVLAHAFYPQAYGHPSEGDIHFDGSEMWSIAGHEDVDVYTVALHEIGHALGLAHSEDPDAIMYPFYTGPRSELGTDDIEGILSLYAPVDDEPEDDAPTLTWEGEVPADHPWFVPGIELQPGDLLSIQAEGEWHPNVGDLNDPWFDADGRAIGRPGHVPQVPTTAGHLCDECIWGVLVMAIGDAGEVTAVGSSLDHDVAVAGPLHLGVNDSRFDDNRGALRVTIRVWR